MRDRGGFASSLAFNEGNIRAGAIAPRSVSVQECVPYTVFSRDFKMKIHPGVKKFQRNQQVSALTVHKDVSFVILALDFDLNSHSFIMYINNTCRWKDKVVQDIVRGVKPIEALRRHGLHYKSDSKE